MNRILTKKKELERAEDPKIKLNLGYYPLI